MDLLLSLPDGGPVKVSRLSVDDTEDQGILFVEQLPYKATASSWHPSGRALAVGDEEGNVFILNADSEEDRRIRELQKLNGTAVAAMEWSKFAPATSVLPAWVFGMGKLPLGTVPAVDPSKESLLVSLSRTGHLAYIVDGSLPIADIRLPRNDDETYCLASMSPTGRHLIAGSVANEAWTLWLVDSSSLASNSRGISDAIRLEERALHLMKAVHATLESSALTLKAHSEEFRSRLGDCDMATSLSATKANYAAESKLRSHILETLTPAKLVKWEREDSAAMENMVSAIIVNADMCVEGLFLACLELQSLSSHRLAFLGIDGSADKLVSSVTRLRRELREFQQIIRLHAASSRAFFQLATAWLGGPQPEKNLLDCLFSGRFCPFENPCDSELRASLKAVESCIVALLTDQRLRVSESLVCNSTAILLGKSSCQPVIQWKQDDLLNICWIEQQSKLHISSVSMYGTAKKAVIDLDAQGGSWNCLSAYSDDELCLVVTVATGLSSISLLDIRELPMKAIETTNIAASDGFIVDVNQLHDSVRAQQLPIEFCQPESLCTSSSRKLASVVANGRMITLDMQPDEEDDN